MQTIPQTLTLDIEPTPKPDCPVLSPSPLKTLRPLRPYQSSSIAELDKRFAAGSKGELLVLPTGCGKSLVAAEWIKPKVQRDEKILFLLNRNKLIKQMRDELEQHGIFPIVEQAENYGLAQFNQLAVQPDGSMKQRTVVIASVQTLRADRLQQWPRDSFDWIVSDEAHGCFPYNTEILTEKGYVKIGDIVENKLTLSVASVNLQTHEVEYKPVVNWFVNPNQPLYKVTHEHGHFICTANHKIWTEHGYVEAARLTPGTQLRKVQQGVLDPVGINGSSDKTVLLEGMQVSRHDYNRVRVLPKRVSAKRLRPEIPAKVLLAKLFGQGGMRRPNSGRGATERSYQAHDRKMLQGLRANVSRQNGRGRKATQILHERMCGQRPGELSSRSRGGSTIQRRASRVESRIITTGHVQENERKQSDAQSRNGGKDARQSSRAHVSFSRRQRKIHKTPAQFDEGAGTYRGQLGMGNRNRTSQRAIPVAAIGLQGGHRHTVIEGRNRSGRQLSQFKEVEVSRQAQNGDIGSSGVVSVESIEQAGGESLSGLRANRNVLFDFEVEGNHNYFAEGVLVSNCGGEQWSRVVGHFDKAQHLGLSATPERTDGKSLDDLFHFPYVKPITMREAVERKFLAPFYVEQVDTGIDLRKVGIVGKDYDQRQLDKLIWENTSFIAEEIYRHGQKILQDGSMKFRPTIVFTPHVNSAEAIAAALRDNGIKAACISYRSPDPDRLYAEFKSGELQCLVNVAILQEGFNAPWVEMVALACPGLSIGPTTQKVGRGTRLSPQTGKEDCKILEFIGKTNSGEGLVGALDIILGDTPLPHNTGEDAKTPKAKLKAQKEMAQKMKDRAQQILDSGETSDLLEAVDLARELIEEENKIERERKLEAGRAKYKRGLGRQAKLKRVNPFGPQTGQSGFNGLAMPNVPRGGRAVDRSAPNSARPEQLRRLQELSNGQLGHASHNVTAEQAGHQIALLETRARIGLASPAQVQTLIRSGIEAPRANTMSAKQAGAIIGSLKRR